MTRYSTYLVVLLIMGGCGQTPPEIIYFTDGSAGVFEFDKGEFEVVNFPNNDINVRITYTFNDYILLELVDSTGKLIDWQTSLRSCAPIETVYVHDTVHHCHEPVWYHLKDGAVVSKCFYCSTYMEIHQCRVDTVRIVDTVIQNWYFHKVNNNKGNWTKEKPEKECCCCSAHTCAPHR